jgi:hypothetical protein
MESVAERVHTDSYATGSVVLALGSFVIGFGSLVGPILAASGIGSAAAIVVGAFSLRRIRASDGHLRGFGIACLGIFLGLCFVVVSLWIVWGALQRGSWGIRQG